MVLKVAAASLRLKVLAQEQFEKFWNVSKTIWMNIPWNVKTCDALFLKANISLCLLWIAMKIIISIIVNHVIFLYCKFKGAYRISMGEMLKVFIKLFSYVLYLRVSILAVMERSRVCWKQDLLEVRVFSFYEFQFSEDFQQITPSASGSGAGLLFPMPKNSLLNDN